MLIFDAVTGDLCEPSGQIVVYDEGKRGRETLRSDALEHLGHQRGVQTMTTLPDRHLEPAQTEFCRLLVHRVRDAAVAIPLFGAGRHRVEGERRSIVEQLLVGGVCHR